MKFEVFITNGEVVIRDSFDKLVHSRHPNLDEAHKSLTVDIASAKAQYEGAQDVADDAREYYLALLHVTSDVCGQKE